MKIPATTQALIARWPLGHIATVTPDGLPNVSPKGTFLVLDDATIAFGEIRSPQTVANLAQNPACEVNFVDAFLRKGARLRGRAELLARGDVQFDTLMPQFRDVWGALCDRMNLIVKIAVDEVKPLSSPPYDTGTSEAEMIALYKAKFAEMYP